MSDIETYTVKVLTIIEEAEKLIALAMNFTTERMTADETSIQQNPSA